MAAPASTATFAQRTRPPRRRTPETREAAMLEPEPTCSRREPRRSATPAGDRRSGPEESTDATVRRKRGRRRRCGRHPCARRPQPVQQLQSLQTAATEPPAQITENATPENPPPRRRTREAHHGRPLAGPGPLQVEESRPAERLGVSRVCRSIRRRFARLGRSCSPCPMYNESLLRTGLQRGACTPNPQRMMVHKPLPMKREGPQLGRTTI